MENPQSLKSLEESQSKRKPYVPPRIVEEASFETFALACPQFTDEFTQCKGSPGGTS